MNLPQEILTRVDLLAAKIGTTAEHFWPEYVNYLWSYALGSLLTGIVAVPLFITLTIVSIHKLDKEKKKDQYDDMVFFYGVVSVLFGVIAVVISLMAFCSLGSTIATLSNPEGAAIQSLMGSK